MRLTLTAIALQSILLAAIVLADTTNLEVDTQKSQISWLGKKVAGQHSGILKLSDGSLTLEDKKLVGGMFKLEMSSIQNDDLKDPKYKAKLENHLKSDDFFNVSKFPLGSFTISGVDYSGEQPVIRGVLNIKGIEREISFPAKIEEKEGVYTGTADLKIDRTNWKIEYNSGKFFDPANLGDKLIYDDIGISLKIVAKPKA